MRYVPILKYKDRIDLVAYEKLSDEIKNNITPLIEVFQNDKIGLEKIKGDKSAFVNLDYNNRVSFKSCVEDFKQIYTTHPKITPVINSAYPFNDLSKKEAISLMRAFINMGFSEYAVKINSIHTLYIQDQLETMLLMFDDFSKVTFFLDIDYAYKYHKSTIINDFEKTLKYLRDNINENITKIVLCGSIVPMQSKEFISFDGDNGENDKNIITNHLYAAFMELRDSHKELDLYYSDYNIDEKNALTDDSPIITSFYPVIKYTMSNADVMVYKSSVKREFKKYPEIAKEISSSSEYFGAEHCQGCGYIKKAIDEDMGGKNTGSPATWKTNMMVHHITVMTNLLK